MPDRSRTSRLSSPGTLVLGACTLWLVIQNTLLALALLWMKPHAMKTVAIMTGKALVFLVTSFWKSPAAPLLIGCALILGLVLPVLLGRGAGREVLHG